MGSKRSLRAWNPSHDAFLQNANGGLPVFGGFGTLAPGTTIYPLPRGSNVAQRNMLCTNDRCPVQTMSYDPNLSFVWHAQNHNKAAKPHTFCNYIKNTHIF